MPPRRPPTKPSKLDAQERSDRARKAAAVANSPAGRARSIVKAWPKMTTAERVDVLDILLAGIDLDAAFHAEQCVTV